jgi:hypothetical protein
MAISLRAQSALNLSPISFGTYPLTCTYLGSRRFPIAAKSFYDGFSILHQVFFYADNSRNRFI